MTDQKQTDGSGLKTLEDLQRTVLIRIVDDDAEVRDALSFMLSCRGWQTAAWGSAEEFLKAWRSTPPGCLLLDIRMPGMSGLELQERMKAQNLSLPIIFVTGHAMCPPQSERSNSVLSTSLKNPLMPRRSLTLLRRQAA